MTYSLRSQTSSWIRSSIRPGVPTIILVVIPSLALNTFFSILTCGSFGTPPNTATLEIPKGFPSEERVSCVCKASSLVGATTRTDMVEWLLALIGHLRRWHTAGMPNAKVLPLKPRQYFHPLERRTDLPVSAIPTTSFPSNAGGQIHACIGVGSLKPANTD